MAGLRRSRRALALLLAAALVPAIAGQTTSIGATADATKSRIAGMGFYTESKLLLTTALLDMGRVAKLGINTVMFDTWWTVTDGSSVVQRQLLKTIDDNLLRQAIAQAKAKGMQVALMPKFTVGANRGWRGFFEPHNPDAFWASYRAMVNHYADLGRDAGASLLFVGSEMSALDTQEAQWRRVIAEVRSRFPGRLAYNENQDATHPSRIKFWDALDIVGTTGYFPLNPAKNPSVATLKESWKRTGLPKLIDMAAKTGKPVMIGEVGYMATSYVGKEPYKGIEYDYEPDLQLRAYQALFETMYQYAWYAGEFWWSWNGNEYRTPKDKPAEDLLKAWYKWGWRPDSPLPAFTGLPLPIPPPQLP